MDYQIKTVLTDTIKIVDDEEIFIEPVCDFFGISFINQKRRISSDVICQSGSTKKFNEKVFGDKRSRLCVTKRAFIRWIQLINPSIVHPNLQDLFIEYQAAVFDFFYNGMELNNAQLEDIRSYAVNINTALGLRRQINEYISEQNNHRNLCLQNSPREWAQIKKSLVQEKSLPEVPAQFKAVTSELSNNIEELKKHKNNIQRNIYRNRYILKYQSHYPQKKENPLPEGYRKEKIKLLIKKYEEKVEEIEQKIIELIDKSI